MSATMNGYREYTMEIADNARLRAAVAGDSSFEGRMRQDPAATLSELGIDVPAGLAVRDLENPDGTCGAYLVIPDELTDDELDLVSGGRLTYPRPPANACGCFANCPPCP